MSNHPLGIELKYGEIPEDFHKENSTKNISGSLYLLHYIPNESIYSALKQLVNSFCNVEIEFSSEPEWLAQIHSPMENVLNPQIANLSSEIDTLTKKRTELLDEIQKYKPWKQLLYETGKPLEEIVLKALELLELENVQPGPKGDHDIVAGFQGESIIFEVKGLTKSAGRQEVFDLYRHLSAFESKHPDKPVRKGILVVNAYRTMAPDLRDKDGRVTFPDDAVKHAVLLEFALLDTRDIYRAVQEIIEGTIQDKQAWFRKIIETVGIYRYSK